MTVSEPETAEVRPPARKPELGLALSGGGFRAAFFHLGVLARLAEVGLLRQVEVISTVSGGSIIGALYYLHVKDLLENVPDEDIGDEHYVWIVECMQRGFLAGVETHVRARTYGDLRRNFAMAGPTYSRSTRIGEVYDETFYRPAWDNPLFAAEPATRPGERIRLQDLVIRPPEAPEGFSPLRRPRRPNAPIPILLMNATSLNTGHNWRFEAVRMGEDGRRRPHWVEIDKNMRLETTRWEELPAEHRDVELGAAVAASSCVPGLFHPLSFGDLFRYTLDGGTTETSVRVELVDGGVHDNQGVCGLIDTDCRRMIVSDASGQMGDAEEPSTRIHAALTRSTSGIYGDRVREEQLAGVLQRHPYALVHLKKGLEALVVPPRASTDAGAVTPEPLNDVRYGLDEQAQRLLSGTRTDLDSFTEIEAYSLAGLGYVMATEELAAPVEPPYQAIDVPRREPPLAGRWDFAGLREPLTIGSPGLRQHLGVAQKRFFKPLRLSRRLLVTTVAGIVVALAALLALLAWLTDLGAVWRALGTPVPLVWVLVVVVGVILLLRLYLKSMFRWKGTQLVADTLYSRVGPALLALPVRLAAGVMLRSNGAFLRAGRLTELELENRRAQPLAKPEIAPRDCPFA